MPFTAKEIRETFLNYFEQHGHKRMRSSSLIPINDPTLLFINAGMNQFKEVFVGKTKRPAPSAVTVQKCMRVSGKHNDLGNVGRTARHHTFFEMLGNFSFGDYFKRDAIKFAWELITEVYKIDAEKLWITIYKDDDEAFDIWHREIGLDKSRIVRMGEKDNFWSMGDVGPCGPCSEIHFDQGNGIDDVWKDEDIYGDSDRYLELWNLVFTQYERHTDGTLTDLPKPSVDTGGGLERFAAVMQGVYSNYETDLFMPIISKICEMSGKKYHANKNDDTSLQVIADHVRACTFLIGDGMLPSNLHRGYVLRRIMRRAIRHGNRLGFDKVFMPDICELVINQMGDTYPELVRNRDFILNVVREEEKGFRRTLNTGLEILNNELDKLNDDDQAQLQGEIAFKLYDTFGFPVDLTEVIAKEKGKGVDIAGFEQAMQEQRERGRASWKGAKGNAKEKLYIEAAGKLENAIQFSGYEKDIDQGTVLAIISEDRLLEQAVQGMDVELVFDKTAFYAESGGQVGDCGLISNCEVDSDTVGKLVQEFSDGLTSQYSGDLAMVVLDTRKPQEGLVVHRGRLIKGTINVGDNLTQIVDTKRKQMIKANHSATHILQYAMREVLGDHVKQSGSFVSAERLRFDFSHFQAVDTEQLAKIEEMVTNKILENHEVITESKSLEQAEKDGAIAFFGDKYGDEVRVVTMSSDSVELCGGTHVQRTGDIGLFKIIHESSIASGIRRIEALTGIAALNHVQGESLALGEVSAKLSVSPIQVPAGLQSLFDQQKADRKKIEQLQKEIAALQSVSLLENAEEISGIKVLCTHIEGVEAKAFRDYGQEVLDKLGHGVILLALNVGKTTNLLLGVSEDLRKAFPAGKSIGKVAAVAGGKGGGRPDMAQAGGADPAKVELAFEKLKSMIGKIEK